MLLRVRIVCLLVCLLFAFFSATAGNLSAIADDSRDQNVDADIKHWVAQLGDADFSVRQAANRHLFNAGVAALPELRKVVDHPDREVSLRAARLVEFLERLELLQKVDAFKRSKTPDDFDMPCWPAFKEKVGDLPQFQSLFADMLRLEIDLLKVAETGSDEEIEAAFASRLELLRSELVPSANTIKLGSICTLYFCLDLRQLHADDLTGRTLVATTALNQLDTAARHGEYSDVVSRLVSKAVFENDDIDDSLIFRFDTRIPSVIPRAKRVALRKDAPAFLRQRGIEAIARIAGEKEIEFMEKLFDDATILRTSPNEDGVDLTTTVGDFAFQMAMQMAKLTAADLGIESSSPLGFPDDEARKLSREKWKQTRAKLEADSDEKE